MRYPSGPQSSNRWQRLATFDETVLREIYRDTTATLPAVLTVAAVMFISSLGGFLWIVLEGAPRQSEFFIESVVIGSIAATGLFFVWAGLVAVITGQIGQQGNNTALTGTVRTLAFATTPFVFSALIFIPGLSFAVTLISISLLLLSTTLATQTSIGGSIGRALGANIFGFFIWITVLSALISRSDTFAPAIFIWDRFGI